MDQQAAPTGLIRIPAHAHSASPACLALIKHFESFQPTKYICAGGMPTIGYGHVIQLHEVELHRAVIDEVRATEILKRDVRRFELALWVLVVAPVTQFEYDALVSLVFNVGPGNKDGIKGDFADSTLLDLLNREERALAAAQFEKWVYSRGRKLAGLVRRRRAERVMFEGGDWRVAAGILPPPVAQ